MAESSSGGTSGYETRDTPVARAAFAPVAATQIQSTLSGASSRPQITGGNVSGSAQRTAPEAPPQGWGGIDNIVDKLVQPRIAQAQRENFWKGVTAARSGQAITDIVASDSPLASIFGPSSYVQGAQFYTSQDALAKYNQEMIANADELARVPPAELGKRLNADSDKYMTGDPGSDALVRAAWIEQTGPALNVITRTRFAQQQAAATQAFTQNANTNAANLQGLALRIGDATATQDDYNAQLKITAEAHMIPPGMTPETYRSLLPQMAKEYADKGNFHAVTFLKQSGALNHVGIEARTKLDDYVDRKEKEAAAQYRYSIMEELSMDRGALDAGTMTAEEWTARVKERSEKFQRVTGVTGTPLIPFSEQEAGALRGVSNWYEGQAKIAAANKVASTKAVTQADKDAAAARETQQITTLLAVGSAGEATSLYGMPKHAVDALGVSAYTSAETPQAADQVLIQNWKGSKYVNDVLKNRFQQGIRATAQGEYSSAVESAATGFQRLVSTPDGAATAAAYYSSEDRVRLERFNMLKQAGQTGPVAFKVAFQDPLTEAVDYNKTYGDDRDIRTVVQDRFTTWYGDTKEGRKPLDDFSQRLVTGLVNKNVRTMLANTGLSTQQAARQEVNALLATGLEVFGGHAWMKQANQGKLESYIRSQNNDGSFDYRAVPPQTLDNVFTQHVEEGIKSVGGKDVESYQVVRLGDAKGVAHFAVIGYTKDGGYSPPYSFNSDDLSRSYEKSLFSRYRAPESKRPESPQAARAF